MGVILFGELLIWICLLSIIEIPLNAEPTGASLILNGKEELVNTNIKQLKYETLKNVDKKNLFKSNFYGCKNVIAESELFQIIKKMPKAASLDGNFFGLFSHEYLYKLTYLSGLYIRITGDKVRFSYGSHNSTDWESLRYLRKNQLISEDFIMKQFSFEDDDFKNYATYIKKLTNVFNIVKTLASKISVLKALLYHMLTEFYADNVMYVEFRYSFDFYDTKIGLRYQPVQVLKIFNRIIKKFKMANPGFFGAKIIYSPVSHKKFDENLGNLLQMVHYYPRMLVGYDVRLDEVNLTRAMAELRKIPIAIQIFFHFNKDVAFKNGTNLNLINSMVNRPSRYAQSSKLLKNKEFYEHIRGLGVGIDIFPLSALRENVLKVRSHQSVQHIRNNYRIIVGTDYPGLLQVTGVSYDWYLLFVLMADETVDLAFLKQLALNSLIYSGLQELDAMNTISIWTKLWYRFIENMQSWDFETIK